MTTTETETPQPIPLPVDKDGNETSAICQTCGVAVPITRGLPLERVEFFRTGRGYSQEPPRSANPARVARASYTQTYTRCVVCAGRRAHAEHLADTYRVSRQLGPVVAHARMEAALVALLALRLPAPTDLTKSELRALFGPFARAGLNIMWRTRADRALGHSLPEPWAHLTPEDHQNLRNAYGAMLADRTAAGAPPVLVPPPARTGPRGAVVAAGGCLMCGVGGVPVPALRVRHDPDGAAEDVWTEQGWKATMLGARRPLGSVYGHTCPACTSAIAEVNAPGKEAIDRAWFTHLNRRDLIDRETTGIHGWGAMVAVAASRGEAPPAPNPEPWAHLSTDGLPDPNPVQAMQGVRPR